MKAVVKERAGPGFALKQIDTPRPKSREALVEVKAVSICGSDVPILEGRRSVKLPLIPGHEFAGTITETGSDGTEWQVGDRVVVRPVIGCGKCRWCHTGEESLCDHIVSLGINTDGAFAEYIAVSERMLHRLPDGLSYEQGTQVNPLATPWRAAEKLGISGGDTVVIIGPGSMGLYMLQVVRARGVSDVLMVGRSRPRLELARQLGAALLIDSSTEDVTGKVREYTAGRMATVVIEATGNVSAVPMVVDVASKASRIGLLGVSLEPTTIDLDKLLRKEAWMTGFFCYSWSDYEESIKLLESGKVRAEPVISHQMPLEKMGEALELLRTREAVKVVLVPQTNRRPTFHR